MAGEQKEPKLRVYVVEHAGDQPTRLVEAQNPSAAIRAVITPVYRARIATQQDLVKLLSAGVPIEKALPEEEEPTPQ